MATSDALDDGVRYVRSRGFDVTRSTDRGEPDAVATPRTGARLSDSLPADDRSLAIERLSEADPTTVLERVAGAAREGRRCLFVATPTVAADAHDVLSSPAFVRRATDGHREFYPSLDRVRLEHGGLAAWRAYRPDYRWEEVPVGQGNVRLVCYDDEQVVARLDSVETLRAPPADAFPYSYRRAADKRLHVTDVTGHLLGVYASYRAMRRAGFDPVPAPLVPEHVLGDRAVSDAWAIAVDDGERITRVLTTGD
ncbi:hypothetical protein [Halomarina oriensis]|uniref:Uncharacterized protein n=1 Tax=Halomarina oriensis TaxID=671145 RepID=A0A6B0GM80_9EURY|nr:hypothetical protein [Halomarina oriensis]MWG34589.1 hypothetical protein [Halomarina oriensis]